jgi:glycosyltransferase involved in cell wall biosynthesis
MDRKDPLLSHQYEAVNSLAENFEKVIVITGKIGEVESNSKIEILSTEWQLGNHWGNLRRLLATALPIIIKGKFKSVFFHMTDLQCALLAPVIRIRGRRQFLWYAHTFRSKYLTFASWWVTNIITSTLGSCPISDAKVVAIGQAIDENKFSVLDSDKLNFSKLVHIGRFDKSKNIELLIKSARVLKQEFSNLQLTLVGSPANFESQEWSKEIIHAYQSEVQDGWLIFKESIPRELFRSEVSQNGCFIHGYIGSLDKTLIESTMLKVPVVTINPEYIAIFGTWGDPTEISLSSEYRALRSMNPSDIDLELVRRLEISKKDHSLTHWVEALSSVLQ